ncbi:MAG: ATP-dependent Clp protease adaptor ClpS [Planctomycetes bacterium]|nr:ATP-dependent Clp protease adaptor ClpS [Planctomycetota bacterium]
MTDQDPPGQTGTVTKAPTRLAPRYRVLVHNDDVTTMEFVVKVLIEVFGLNAERAMKVMAEAHFKNVALVTVLPLEEAEFRVEKAHAMARGAMYPLTFSYEPEG